MINAMTRIVFLLGSGISIDAGKPSTKDITSQVFSGHGVFLHSDKRFVIDAEHSNYELYRPDAEPVLKLVERMRCVTRDYFQREPNYEQVATVARAVGDTLSGEYESPAVMPFVRQLQDEGYAGGDHNDLRYRCQLVCHYIADTVRHMLRGEPKRLDQLDAIVQACREFSHPTLASLNHDLVLEAALSSADISYSDGFEQSDADTNLWSDRWDTGSVPLLKLHGSLDWWAYKLKDELWRGWVAARYKGQDPLRPERHGIEPDPYDYRPLLLIGTYDKILAYETWIFPDQHLRFHEELRTTNRVVVIGYGFGDKAINSRLIGWLARARDNKLIVCHPSPDRLFCDARPAIKNKRHDWEHDGQLATIPDEVATLTYETIANHVGAV